MADTAPEPTPVASLLIIPAACAGGALLYDLLFAEEEQQQHEALEGLSGEEAERMLEDQHTSVTIGQIGATVTTAGVLGGAYLFTSADTTRAGGLVDRLHYTLRWEALTLVPLAYSLGRLAKARFSSKQVQVVAGKDGSDEAVELEKSIVQDTLEQTCLAVPAHFILASYLKPEQMQLIPALVSLFVTGRLLYIRGSTGGTNPDMTSQRSYGYYLTFLPTAVSVGAVTYYLSKMLLGN